jgi:kynurenine 3-monooxygenase
VSFPWQYPAAQSKVGRFLWMVQLVATMALNKLLPGLFAPPAFFMIQARKRGL